VTQNQLRDLHLKHLRKTGKRFLKLPHFKDPSHLTMWTKLAYSNRYTIHLTLKLHLYYQFNLLQEIMKPFGWRKPPGYIYF
jgi:hypothetical protein